MAIGLEPAEPKSFNRKLHVAITESLEPHWRRTCDLVCAKAKTGGIEKVEEERDHKSSLWSIDCLGSRSL